MRLQLPLHSPRGLQRRATCTCVRTCRAPRGRVRQPGGARTCETEARGIRLISGVWARDACVEGDESVASMIAPASGHMGRRAATAQSTRWPRDQIDDSSVCIGEARRDRRVDEVAGWPNRR